MDNAEPISPEPPLVLLDVDGVVNDVEAMMALRLADDQAAAADQWDVDVVESDGIKLAIPRHMGELVRALTAETEVWWCTTWRQRASNDIATHLDIEALPVIDDGSEKRTTEWKTDAARGLVAEAIAAGRLVAWIEDFGAHRPDLAGVIYVDTTDYGHLRWSDLSALTEALQ
jgi:hypothetical protein